MSDYNVKSFNVEATGAEFIDSAETKDEVKQFAELLEAGKVKALILAYEDDQGRGHSVLDGKGLDLSCLNVMVRQAMIETVAGVLAAVATPHPLN